MGKNKGYSEDWIDVMDAFLNYDKFEAEFDSFWNEVEAYATEHNVSTRYIEEEFLIDGEFQTVNVQYMHQLDNEDDYPERA